jgi:transposase
MRVTTAFNKMLGLSGASVRGVSFTPDGVVVALGRRRAKHACPCGWKTWAIYDRSVRRWRHLDLGAAKCFFEAEIVRVDCPWCGRVRTEEVPWARPGARHTRDLQDVVAWLAQRTDKTTITRLLRVSWEAVAKIVVDVVAERLDGSRLNNLYRIGVDEVSYRKGHRYLTVVADHDNAGAVVWVGEGKNANTLDQFYVALGWERCQRLEAVSMDLGLAYASITRARARGARQCADPFHVVKLANDALDKARRGAWNETRRRDRPEKGPLGANLKKGTPERWIKQTRWALLKDYDALSEAQIDILHALRKQNSVLYRAWQLKEALRDLYKLKPADAPEHLEWWLRWASRSRIASFVKLAKTIRNERQRILWAIELGLSNSKLEGLNSKIRLINHRGYGHHSATALIAMIYLCCGGITVELPSDRWDLVAE